MPFRATILGSGSSGGVPRIGGHWGKCDPNEPRNRRRRCSLLIEKWSDDPAKKTTVLVDTSPDMRDQLLDTGTEWIDGVLYTHDHADQCHGIDDLRMIAINRRRRVDVWMDDRTSSVLTHRFDYCFRQLEGSSYPAILDAHRIEASGTPVTVEGEGGPVTAVPFLVNHGDIDALGFRFGPLAYCPDVVAIPEESFPILEGVDTFIVDALRYTPHPTHAHVDLSVSWIERVKARRGVLTNLHVELDYRTLEGELPAHIVPAYDLMHFEFDD